MKSVLKPLLFIACLSTAAGCASPRQTEPLPAPAEYNPLVSSPTLTAPTEPVQYGSFTREQLTQAILSEMGGQRGYYDSATQNYYELAKETRDVGIIRRALQFASATGESANVLELAELWSRITPEDIEPQLLLGYQFLETGQFELALQNMIRVIELGGTVDFTALTARTQDIPAAQRATIRTQIEQLRQRWPREITLHFALIQLLDQDGNTATALSELQKVQKQLGESPQSFMVQAQLQQKLGQSDAAMQTLQKSIERYSENRLLRYSYAQVLVAAGNLTGAREQFIILARQEPEDFETLYSLGLLNLEMEAFDEARSIFTRMLDIGYRNNDSRFYMGYINEAQGQINAAIGQYRQVRMDSNNFLNAQRQVIRLLVAQQRFDEASQWAAGLTTGQPRLTDLFVTIEADALMSAGEYGRAARLLDNAISSNPRNTDLLFARTLLHERQGDMAAAEIDLRRIIELAPDDARALNHLGYTLADRTDRHQEALDLIERAIAIAPDDPAIIDSLGWVMFKLKRYEEALVNLKRAYELFPDHEVAAHLGEVLWVMGRRREAGEVWEQALEQHPDSELLMEVMQRLRSGTNS
jgi:tetratricopeptide (TPR) repeat protein